MLLGLDKINPERIAARDSAGLDLSYGDITGLSAEIAGKIRPRSVVLVSTHNDAGAICWIIALIAAGAVPIIISDRTEATLYDRLYRTYRPHYICRSPHTEDGAVGTAAVSKFGYGIFPTDEPEYDVNPLLSHLLPTSGTTGSPKLVRHRYENIEASALNISTFFRLTEDERALLVLPLHYTMGLSVVFSHLRAGATVLVTDLAMTEPGFWKFLKENEATSFTGVPFSYEILDRLRFTRMKLPRLKLLTQGGGKMPEALNLKFAEYCIQNDKRWVATYGMSEGTARMAWLPEEYALSKIGSIGIAVPNGRLSIRDRNGVEIEESPAEGELCYEGRNVTMGYAESISDLAKGDERNGFLATGDIALRDKDGFYYIKGRLGRFLKIFGNRVALDECESIVREKVGCECVCTGSDQRLLVYMTEHSCGEKALKALAETTHLPANVIEIRIIDKIPKNEAGKILYAQLSKD